MERRKLRLIEEKNKRFFSLISKIYDKGPVGGLLKRIIRRTIAESKIKSGARILDVGCGTGNLLLMLKDKKLDLYGVDISNEMLQEAKRKLPRGIILKMCSATSLSECFKRNYFDYVFMVDALHHFPDQEKAIKQAYTVIKRKGMLIVTDFNFGKIGNFIFKLLEPGNTGLHTKGTIQALFKKAGFSTIKQKRIGLFSLMTSGTK